MLEVRACVRRLTSRTRCKLLRPCPPLQADSPASAVSGLAVSDNVFYATSSAPFAVNETGGRRWASVLDFTATGTVLGYAPVVCET